MFRQLHFLKIPFAKLFSVLILCVLFFGCATSNDLNQTLKSDSHNTVKIAVDIFGDKRLERDYFGEKFVNRYIWETNHKSFNKEIGVWLSNRFVKTIKGDLKIQDVQLVQASDKFLRLSDHLDKLSKDGFDVFVKADVSHLHGYVYEMTTFELVTVSYFRNLWGFFAQNLMDPKNMGADVGYSNVQIIDCRTQEVLWQGDIRYVFDEETKFVQSPKKYAYRALEEVNRRLVKRIEEIIIGDSVLIQNDVN